MAEDQGYNGNLWNDQAVTLFEKLGWTSVGDRNIDVTCDDEKKRGVDCLLKFLDIRKSNLEQSVILESKRYQSSSFNDKSLREWVETLNTKISKTRCSEKFYEMYPELKDTDFRNGVIAIWFTDTSKYNYDDDFFKKALTSINLPKARSNKSYNRIYVIENKIILKLCSLIESMNTFNRENNLKLEFYYPQSDQTNTGISRFNHLTIDYIFSKIILTEGVDESGKVSGVVFYFGKLDKKSFSTLYDFLNSIGFIDYNKNLNVFYYKNDDDFRKIEPDINNIFSKDIAGKKFTCRFRKMNLLADLPDFLTETT